VTAPTTSTTAPGTTVPGTTVPGTQAPAAHPRSGAVGFDECDEVDGTAASDPADDSSRLRTTGEATGETARESSSDEGQLLDVVAREHLPGLLRYATTLTGDPHQAADIVQEVLVRAHSRWRRIGLLERPDLYLRRMVTNEHLSWRRRWHVRSVRPSTDEVLAARATPVADHAHRVADHDALHRALGTLTPRQRTVLVLRYFEGLDDGDIATVLGTSRATVRSHVSHALAALRDATGGQELL